MPRFSERLAPFFDEFATDATFDGVAVVGIWDVEHFEENDVEGAVRVFTMETANVPPGAANGSTLIVDGASYKIVEITPPEDGVTDIRVHEV